MRDRGLRPLRQQHTDPIAAPDAEPEERVGATVGETLQIVEAEARDTAVGHLVDQREAALAGGMPVARRDADVEAGGQLPAEAAVRLVVAVAAMQHRLLRGYSPSTSFMP